MTQIPTLMRGVQLAHDIARVSDEAQVRAALTVSATLPVPKCGFSDVLIKIVRAQINPSDSSFCQGRYGVRLPFPCIPGFECTGIVVAHGGSPLAWRLMGRRVSTYLPKGGAWAEYAVANCMRVIPLEDATSWENAAGAVANPMTVLQMMRIAQEGNHRAIVLTAGASACSLQLARSAHRAKISVVSVVRKPEHIEICKAAGATHALDASSTDFVEELRKVCKDLNCKLAFDSVAGEIGTQVFQALQNDGCVVVYGFLSGQSIQASGSDLIFKNKTIRGLFMSREINKLSLLQSYKMIRQVVANLSTDLSTRVRATFSLELAADALLAATKDMSDGKVHILLEQALAEV